MASKLLLDSNLYYFDGHIGITNNNSNWSNTANAFDGSTATFSTPTAAGSNTSNYLYGQGTTAPSTGSAVISSVQARIYGVSGSVGSKLRGNVYTSGGAEQLTTTGVLASSAANSTTDWGTYVTLTAPAAGWSWATLQSLEVKFYDDQISCSVALCELLVSYGSPSDALLLENTIRAYETISGDSFTLGASGTATGIGQAVQGTGVAIGDVSFYLKKTGAPTGNYTAKVYATTGSFSSTATATGTALATSDNFDISTLTTAFNWAKFTFSGANQITLTNGTTYAITFEYNGGDASNLLTVGWDATFVNDPGNAMRLIGTWGSSGSADANYILNSNTTSYLLQENDVQLRQSTFYRGTAAQTNMTFTLPNAPVVGNLLIVNVMYFTGDDPFLTPSGWTLKANNETGQGGIATIYRVVQAGDTASWNLTVLSVADQNSGYMWEVMGQHATPATAFNQYSYNEVSSATTTITSNSITPSVLNTMVLSVTLTIGTTGTDVATYSAGWSERKFINSTFQPAWAYQKNGYTTDTTTAINYTVSTLPSAQAATLIMAIAPDTGVATTTLSNTKSLQYAVVKPPTAPTKSLKYTVKTTPAAITKSLKYTVKKVLSTTKSLKYTVTKAATAITKSLKYTTKTTPSAATKSLKYTIKTTASAITRSLKYTVKRSLSITKGLIYDIKRTPAAVTKSLRYAIKITKLTTSIASYWKLDELSGLTAYDSYSSNDGTWQGTLGSQWGTGKLNGDGVFNGTDNYILVGDKTNLSFNTGAYTLSAWVKTSATSRQTILHKYQYTGTSVESGYYIDMLAGGNLRTVYETTNANLRNTDSSVTVNDGNFHLVTVVRPSTTGDILLYVDGTLDTSSTHAFNAGTPGNIDNTIPFAIGQSISASIGVNNWNGQIDEVGMWSRALTSTEITSLYNAGTGLAFPFGAFPQKVMRYTVKKTLSTTKSLQYDIRKAIALTKSLKYTVIKAVPITKQLNYDIKRTPTALTKSLKYTILNRAFVAFSYNLKYTIRRTPTAQTKSLKYSVVKQASAITKSLRYAISRPQSAITKSLRYAIAKPISVTKSLKYTIRKNISVTKGLIYKVKPAVALTKALKYTVTGHPAVTKSLAYVLSGGSKIVKGLKYTVKSSRSTTKSLKYTILNTSTSSVLNISSPSSLSGTATNTLITITLPTYSMTDYIVLFIASNNGNAQTFGSNVTATSLASASNRLNAWKIVPQDGSQTSFTVSVSVSSVFTWYIATYTNVAAATVYGAGNNIGNSTTSPIEIPNVTAGYIATGRELVLSAASVNATATWTTTGNTLYNTTSGNAALQVQGTTLTAGALTAVSPAIDRGLAGTSRNESALAIILQAPPVGIPNLLSNASFEDAAATSSSWATEGNTIGTPAYTKLTSGAVDGTNRQQMQYAGQAGDTGKFFAIYQSPITATPGQVLTFSIYLSGSVTNASLIIGIEGFSTGNVYISESDTSITGLTSTMTKYIVTYTCPINTVAVAVYIQANELTPTSSVTVQMDKAILVDANASLSALLNITKSLRYAIAKPLSITKTLQYTVKKSGVNITKSLAYNTKRTNQITKSLIYALRRPLSQTKALQYVIRRTPAITKALTYRIKRPLSLTKQLIYDVKKQASITKPLKYSIVINNSLTKALIYRLKTSRPITKALTYYVITVSTNTKKILLNQEPETLLLESERYIVPLNQDNNRLMLEVDITERVLQMEESSNSVMLQ